MFPEMRRKNQQLSDEESVRILLQSTSGVLAVTGADGWPYAVPLSYVYDGGKLYFHCATTGHKLDALRFNPKASFCVIQQDQVVPEEYTTYYRSVIAFGTVRVLENEAEKLTALVGLANRYWPEAGEQRRSACIDGSFEQTLMLELVIEHVTGKESIELTKQRTASDSRPVRV